MYKPNHGSDCSERKLDFGNSIEKLLSVKFFNEVFISTSLANQKHTKRIKGYIKNNLNIFNYRFNKKIFTISSSNHSYSY